MSLQNSHEIRSARRIIAALFKDCGDAYPLDVKDFQRDLNRILSCVDSRGLTTLLLDLPTVDSALLDLLETGTLPRRFFLSKKRSRKDTRPAFLHALWKRVVDTDGVLIHDPCITAIFMIRQISCFFKKLEKDCSDERKSAQLMEYDSIESELPEPSLDWDDPFPSDLLRGISFEDVASQSDEDRELLRNLDRVSAILSLSVGEFIPSQWRHGRHGPGAVSDRYSRSKYEVPVYPTKLEQYIFPEDEFGDSLRSSKRVDIVRSNLIQVPKSAKGPRLVASEPIANMWVQQKVADFLEREGSHLLGYFFQKRDQTLSQHMVLRSSRTRESATIDLSSASDRLSCYMIERFWRKNPSVLSALIACRTPIVFDRQRNLEIKIKKFAAQGSALTFPVQSTFFLGVALAALGCKDRRSIRAMIGKVRTFGDDIIIPNGGYARVTRLLTILGLKVNEGKSFHRGFFRESCGADAYMGYDVTPCKPKTINPTSAEHVQAIFDTSNNLFLKGMWNTAKAVDAIWEPILGPQVFSAPVRGSYTLCAGSNRLASFSVVNDTFPPNLPIRENRRYQRFEVGLRRVIAKPSFTKVHDMPALRYFLTTPHSDFRPREAQQAGKLRQFIGVVWEELSSCIEVPWRGNLLYGR